MVPTNSIAVFLRHNDSELRYMVSDICKSLKYPCTDDLIQDIYLKFLSANTLQGYNRHYCTGKNYYSTKMSTFLFPIIRNYIIGRFNISENKVARGKCHNFDAQGEEIDIDDSLNSNEIAMEYRDIIDYNESSDSIHGLGFNLRDFEGRLNKLKKNVNILKRKKNKACFPEGTLLEVFRYLYKGYSSKEIAQIYGVSNMAITHLKHKIAVIMMDLGFSLD